jgi:hypothetical protein
MQTIFGLLLGLGLVCYLYGASSWLADWVHFSRNGYNYSVDRLGVKLPLFLKKRVSPRARLIVFWGLPSGIGIFVSVFSFLIIVDKLNYEIFIFMLFLTIITTARSVGVLFDEEFFLGPEFFTQGTYIDWFIRHGRKLLVVLATFIVVGAAILNLVGT